MEEEIQKVNSPSSSIPLVLVNIALVSLVMGLVFVIVKEERTRSVLATAARARHVLDTSMYDNLDLKGSNVLVFDTTTKKILFAKDADTPRPLASLTKIMTAVTARSLVPTSETVTIQKEFLQEEGDSGLRVGEKWSLKNILDFSLVVSSNDGARAIASAVAASQKDMDRAGFIQEMNRLAARMGLTTLRFTNETGLDAGTEYGGIGSAQDMATLLEYALREYPDLFEATKKTSLRINSSAYMHPAVNTNTALEHMPGVIASKTGYTSAAGGNLIVAFDAGMNRPVIVVVLGSTQDGRFTDVEKLASSTLAFIRANQ